MEELLAIIKQQTSTIEQLTNELTLLREQVDYLRQKLYGKSSEKVVYQPGQLSLFGEEILPEEEADLPSLNGDHHLQTQESQGSSSGYF
ncbi:TPA: transposase [Streptococcus suis]